MKLVLVQGPGTFQATLCSFAGPQKESPTDWEHFHFYLIKIALSLFSFLFLGTCFVCRLVCRQNPGYPNPQDLLFPLVLDSFVVLVRILIQTAFFVYLLKMVPLATPLLFGKLLPSRCPKSPFPTGKDFGLFSHSIGAPEINAVTPDDHSGIFAVSSLLPRRLYPAVEKKFPRLLEALEFSFHCSSHGHHISLPNGLVNNWYLEYLFFLEYGMLRIIPVTLVELSPGEFH